MPLHISQTALAEALERLPRHGVFSDFLSLRYAAPDAASLTYTFPPPTGRDSPFADATAILSGLTPRECDPSEAGWKLHWCYKVEEKPLSFHALAPGGRPGSRNARWKWGGRDYARSGVQRRFEGGRPDCGVQEYAPDPGTDRWRLELTPDYTDRIFDLIGRRPIHLWNLVAWLLRYVRIPRDDPEEAYRWARDGVTAAFHLNADQMAATEADAIALGAWLYAEPLPDPARYFSGEPLAEAAVRDLCLAFDDRLPGGGALAPAIPGEPDYEDEEELANEDLMDILLRTERGRLDIPADVVRSLIAHVRLGKHVLLIGPPGTGKTTLAKNLAKAAEMGVIPGLAAPAGVAFATATASWTAFDTTGGYVPRRDGSGLRFRPNLFLRAFAERRWVVVDELNRADVDKAFGPMLTVLSGFDEPLTLPYEDEVRPAGGTPETVEVRILPAGGGGGDASRHQYMVPPDWRMVGTMNTYDKNSLFRLSYAFIRRFAIVYVDVLPPGRTVDLALRSVRKRLSEELRAAVQATVEIAAAAGRPLGPAIALDIARYVAARASELTAVEGAGERPIPTAAPGVAVGEELELPMDGGIVPAQPTPPAAGTDEEVGDLGRDEDYRDDDDDAPSEDEPRPPRSHARGVSGVRAAAARRARAGQVAGSSRRVRRPRGARRLGRAP